MRRKVANQGLTLQAIAGTYVVLLGFDMEESDCDGLMGFAIHRTDHTDKDKAFWLEGSKTFSETDPGRPRGSTYSTREHPIQGFTWSDFSAEPGHEYTYLVLALKGSPSDLLPIAEASVKVKTESPEGGVHDVYFNRGVAASREYLEQFGNRKPEEVGPQAFTWLSRGLYEAMIAFIRQASGPGYELRVCAYQLQYQPVLVALREAKERDVNVRIIYHRRDEETGGKNDEAVQQAGISPLCIKRMSNPSAISHNKFIVLLKDGRAQSVLTGGTNFTENGIFGHSNTVHVVEEPEVARAYSRCWELLSEDPMYANLRPALSATYQIPEGKPPTGTGVIFSPRDSFDALDWYASLAAEAEEGLFATFAFGINDRLQEAYRTGRAGMRYALLETATAYREEGPKRDAEEAKILELRMMPENRFAIGTHLKRNMFDRWLEETSPAPKSNVRYIHTKYMLIDPLGPDPIVITGSANFSESSTKSNDENMLIIRGNKRVAEIYLGEFMRLYRHYAFREWASTQPTDSPKDLKHLETGNEWWEEYFGNTTRAKQREYFAS